MDGCSPKNDLVIKRILRLNSTKTAEIRAMWHHATATDSHAIGWLPTKAFDIRAENGDLSAVYRNDDLVGWAMHSPSRSRGVMKLYQIWVRPDARILEHGRALVAEIQAIARSLRCYMIEAWVAEDLPANVFWRAIGFSRKTWRWGKGEKKRKHWLWVVSSQDFPHIAISGKKQNTTLAKEYEWRKKNKTSVLLPSYSNNGERLTKCGEV